MDILKCAIKTIVKFIICIIGTSSNILFEWFYRGKKKTLPPITDPILLETATSLAEKIRTKKLKSKQVVQSFIKRIEEINPILNCVVDTFFDEALQRAEEVDKLIEDGQLTAQSIATDTPFLGVPFSTKDSIGVKGCVLTAGLVSRRKKICEKDSDCVELMRKAGAIPLALTNVSELCMWWESSNYIYGITNNPYDTTRIVGGSSGGEGCLLSAAGSPFGIGSDIGGSLRMPSFFNGIFGHKPSRGIVSNEGHFPQAEPHSDKILATGPMCRFTSDLLPMLNCLGGSNVPNQVFENRVDIKTLKIYYMEDNGGIPITTPVDKELRVAQQKVIEYFASTHGIIAQKVNMRKILNTMEMWTTQMSAEDIPTFSCELTERKGELNPFIEFLKWIIRRSDHTLPAIALSITEKIMSSLRKNGEKRTHFINMLEEFKKEFSEMLGNDGIFLYPSHPTVAPYHHQPIFLAFNFLYTALFSALQAPVTQCPLGLSSSGLPLGIQVVSRSNNDHLCLTVASELEKAFGGWVCPSVVSTNS